MAPEQLPLLTDGRSYWARLGIDFRAHLKEVYETLNAKQVAADLGVDGGALSHAMSGTKRHVIHADWVPYFIARAKNDEALASLATLRQKDLVEAKPADPSEELSNLKGVMAEMLSPEIRRVILGAAKARRR